MGTAITLASTVIGPRSTTRQCKIPLHTVDLGNAAHFAILASTTVTDAGGSRINGDMGTTGTFLPTYDAYKEGTPGLNGTLHLNDVEAQLARTSAKAALTDIEGRCDCWTSLGSIVELGGRTLTPGLYTSTSSFHSKCCRALHLTFPTLARI